MNHPATISATLAYDHSSRVLVIFSGEAEPAWLRLILKKGFRHCFIVIDKKDHWIICNPLFHQTEIVTVRDTSMEELANWYRSIGLTVVDSFVRNAPHRAAPWRPYTCVEAVKRMMGIQSSGILTPRQLYNHLIKENSKKILDII